jgi:transposase
MRTLSLIPHLTDEQLIAKLNEFRSRPEFSRWQILYLVQVGKLNKVDLLVPLVGLSKPSIYKIIEGYNKRGVSAIVVKSRGGRRRSLLSVAEEEALVRSISEQAAKGLIKTANDIRVIVESRVGKEVSDDFLWDLLKRNGWKKKVPRPHHPKRNKAEQDSFKKNSPTYWMPAG